MNMHSVQGETSQNSLKYVHILKFEHIFKEYNSHKTLKDLSFHWLIILTLNLNTVLTHIACYIGQRGKNWVSVYSLMATHSSTLAWKIPWTEERGRLQSMGSQTVRHDWTTLLTWTIKYLTLIFMLLFAILWFNSNHKGMRICKLFWGRLAHLIIHGKRTLQNLKDNLELNFFCTNQYQK